MVSDKCPGNAFRTFVNHLSKIRAFKLHLEIAFFQMLTPPGIKPICWLWFSIFCRDIHCQKTVYLSAVRHKIKIANYYFGSKKTDIEWHVTFLFFFFFFFFLFSVFETSIKCLIFIQSQWNFVCMFCKAFWSQLNQFYGKCIFSKKNLFFKFELTFDW